jgi:toxin-antitoxin system PIN domain toxin
MLVVDLNVVIYATNRDSSDHRATRTWWEAALSGDEPIGLSWTVLLGFVRITTHPRILANPLSFEQAAGIVDHWLQQPVVRILEPSERHWGILKDLLEPFGTAGNMTTDADLAALAVEHGATLCSTDRDFARFPRLKGLNPLDQ